MLKLSSNAKKFLLFLSKNTLNQDNVKLKNFLKESILEIDNQELKEELAGKFKTAFKFFKKKLFKRLTLENNEAEASEVSDPIELEIPTQQTLVDASANTKVKFPINLYLKKPHLEESLDSLSGKEQNAVLAFYGLNNLGKTDSFSNLLDIFEEKLQINEKRSKILPWLSNCKKFEKLCIGSEDPELLQNTMLFFLSNITPVAENCVQHQKKKRARILLKHITLFLQHCHVLKRTISPQKVMSAPSYEDIMAALLSIYIDLEVIACEEDSSVISQRIIAYITSLLGSCKPYCLDVLLQISKSTRDNKQIMWPIFWSLLYLPPDVSSCSVYLRYIICVKYSKFLTDKKEYKPLLRIAGAIPAPPGFWKWLLSINSDLSNMISLKNMKGTEITSFLMKRSFNSQICQDLLERLSECPDLGFLDTISVSPKKTENMSLSDIVFIDKKPSVELRQEVNESENQKDEVSLKGTVAENIETLLEDVPFIKIPEKKQNVQTIQESLSIGNTEQLNHIDNWFYHESPSMLKNYSIAINTSTNKKKHSPAADFFGDRIPFIQEPISPILSPPSYKNISCRDQSSENLSNKSPTSVVHFELTMESIHDLPQISEDSYTNVNRSDSCQFQNADSRDNKSINKNAKVVNKGSVAEESNKKRSSNNGIEIVDEIITIEETNMVSTAKDISNEDITEIGDNSFQEVTNNRELNVSKNRISPGYIKERSKSSLSSFSKSINKLNSSTEMSNNNSLRLNISKSISPANIKERSNLSLCSSSKPIKELNSLMNQSPKIDSHDALITDNEDLNLLHNKDSDKSLINFKQRSPLNSSSLKDAIFNIVSEAENVTDVEQSCSSGMNKISTPIVGNLSVEKKNSHELMMQERQPDQNSVYEDFNNNKDLLFNDDSLIMPTTAEISALNNEKEIVIDEEISFNVSNHELRTSFHHDNTSEKSSKAISEEIQSISPKNLINELSNSSKKVKLDLDTPESLSEMSPMLTRFKTKNLSRRHSENKTNLNSLADENTKLAIKLRSRKSLPQEIDRALSPQQSESPRKLLKRSNRFVSDKESNKESPRKSFKRSNQFTSDKESDISIIKPCLRSVANNFKNSYVVAEENSPIAKRTRQLSENSNNTSPKKIGNIMRLPLESPNAKTDRKLLSGLKKTESENFAITEDNSVKSLFVIAEENSSPIAKRTRRLSESSDNTSPKQSRNIKRLSLDSPNVKTGRKLLSGFKKTVLENFAIIEEEPVPSAKKVVKRKSVSKPTSSMTLRTGSSLRNGTR